MKVIFHPTAKEDMVFWQKHNPVINEKIKTFIQNIMDTPFKGLGKPEPLKGDFSGCWSRRITQEHRLIYKVEGHGENMVITILQCRYHYAD
ncbi:MAG: Txe/YoeB family addiction module toxin [Alphaproteobacteria bacterium]|nr:Txe/YoeB family addiction module toxin [Alphaproteobacteria bacterium]